MEKDLQRITSEAYKTAEVKKGEADGQATKIYAQAYNKDPQFIHF
jgi:membrane protease subunit HflC